MEEAEALQTTQAERTATELANDLEHGAQTSSEQDIDDSVAERRFAKLEKAAARRSANLEKATREKAAWAVIKTRCKHVVVAAALDWRHGREDPPCAGRGSVQAT